MTKKTSLVVAAVVLFIAILALGSRPQSATASQQDDKGNNSDNQEKVIELNKFERAAQVTIKPVSTDLATAKARFSVSGNNEKMLVAVAMTNTSAEPIGVVLGDPRIQHRPRLLKDGKLLPYKEEVVKVVRAKDKSGPGSGRVIGGEIKPGETVTVDYINLADWYGPLEPGQYQLTLKYRFRFRGRPVETNTVNFEVVP